MPLFIDRLSFHSWTDPTRTPALTSWTVVLPVILTEPTLLTPPPVAGVQEWVVDTGNRGEAFAWRQHLIQAGLDPDQGRMPQPMAIRTVAGRLNVPPTICASTWPARFASTPPAASPSRAGRSDRRVHSIQVVVSVALIGLVRLSPLARSTTAGWRAPSVPCSCWRSQAIRPSAEMRERPATRNP